MAHKHATAAAQDFLCASQLAAKCAALLLKRAAIHKKAVLGNDCVLLMVLGECASLCASALPEQMRRADQCLMVKYAKILLELEAATAAGNGVHALLMRAFALRKESSLISRLFVKLILTAIIMSGAKIKSALLSPVLVAKS